MGYGWIKILLVAELCISLSVVLFVSYTEIDWNAYMQEVKGFLEGELDYRRLGGDTGPLVYPGGFVWTYSALYFITKEGKDIAMAQWLYAGMYIMLFAVVAQLYMRCKIRGRLLIRLLLSKRIRSLFLLRLFNDCWAILLLYFAVVALATGRRWKLGCLLYSMAVSVKMNIFLFAPGLLLILCRSLPWHGVISCLTVCAMWQVGVALPFLLWEPQGYIQKAFELGRVFTHRWTVNFKCVPEEVFVSKEFGQVLLLLTVLSWLLLWRRRWSKRRFLPAQMTTQKSVELGNSRGVKVGTSDDEVYRNIVLTMMESNLIGAIFARSLHYQFLVWFFHSMPMVLSATRLPFPLQIASVVAVQYGFEAYPSTAQSSMVLLCGFFVAWYGIVWMGEDGGRAITQRCKREAARGAASAMTPTALPIKC
ncbi:putative dolichyl-P-Man:GDP-Man5GlcNAc2-PP-dolichyl alpha-1,3-mannosyltransferase [Trypanosoma rangeli]|uniref:dolichyl-P-Man:Man5GlcNAc2-PP-dolichol alpha-1,3-mannosyltransferase n=1 Tax=Trypanosoma rangeli TaxID=5698 RepID=A0A3R7K2K2_TRYRA|nr:putative dolichyl-P-Man:GDP-Man5GlcNAc2-PP-dolichyl alpha-1,3-mannosyltransferase [Trypanosoma rangeli]RNE99418.1 putative dolichyl-P-Man:GDP-Man5GlcNAc2-PP-dolichyl alpha-1,3-mannosyltransferase [Trypanosoma rangeli]|eukprot:RNE99418.1 putative dolichyl-P-Man:GDP-Man5GlcNAc2-PP-dolichyl alpha-1,3-mannosyltransferase [Trypanosoma rangeli]